MIDDDEREERASKDTARVFAFVILVVAGIVLLFLPRHQQEMVFTWLAYVGVGSIIDAILRSTDHNLKTRRRASDSVAWIMVWPYLILYMLKEKIWPRRFG